MYLFHNPDSREIQHSNVLPRLQTCPQVSPGSSRNSMRIKRKFLLSILIFALSVRNKTSSEPKCFQIVLMAPKLPDIETSPHTERDCCQRTSLCIAFYCTALHLRAQRHWISFRQSLLFRWTSIVASWIRWHPHIVTGGFSVWQRQQRWQLSWLGKFDRDIQDFESMKWMHNKFMFRWKML